MRVYCPAAGGQRFTGQAAGPHKSVHSVVLLPARRELERSGTCNCGIVGGLPEIRGCLGGSGYRGWMGVRDTRWEVTLQRSPMDAVS